MTKEERERIKNYYLGKQYEAENIILNTPNLFIETLEIYNPLKNIVQGLTQASVKDLQINLDNEILNEIWKTNNMKYFKNKICSETYLYEVCYVEVILLPDKKTINYKLYSVDEVQEVEESNGMLNKFKITGKETYYDEKGDKTEIDVSREYIRSLLNGNFKVIKIESNNGQEMVTPFGLDYIPVIKFEFKSNIIKALNLIDNINEKEAYIRSIFSIHGDPELHASNIEPFGIPETAEGIEEKKNLKENNYKNKRIIFTRDDSELKGFFKYIELTNPLITEMQADIVRNENRLNTLFPEILLVDTKTQNVSSETFSMKNNGLRSKITDFRTCIIKGIFELDKTALKMLSKETAELTIDSYKYLDPFLEEEKEKRINNIVLALDIIEKAKNIDTENQLAKIIDNVSKDTLKELEALYD